MLPVGFRRNKVVFVNLNIAMNFFWRESPPSEDEERLLDLVFQAHARSAMRDNASTVALKNAAKGSGRLECGLIAALASVGGQHAPIADIYRFLDQTTEEMAAEIHGGHKALGWGNGFFKNRPDPDWVLVSELLKPWPQLCGKIESITQLLHSRGKRIYPNAGCYTAATAIVTGMPAKLAPWLLIQGRLAVWSALAAEP